MKKNTKIILPVILLLLGSILGWLTYKKITHKKIALENIQHLPIFKARSLNGQEEYYRTNVNQQLVLIYFDPDCDHCQREAEQLQHIISELPKTQYLWLSTASLPTMKSFSHAYGIDTSSVMHIRQISAETAYSTFGFRGVPDIIIYGENKVLIQRFKGETNPTILAKYLLH